MSFVISASAESNRGLCCPQTVSLATIECFTGEQISGRDLSWFKSPVFFLLTVPRRFFYCSSFLFLRLWCHMWRLCCPCLFLTLFFRCLGRNMLLDFDISWVASPLRKHAVSNILKILQPNTGKFSDKKILIFFLFLLKT